ncbi:hypothetical protein ACFU5O_33705 [Streptomyces sp. NPDC057445]|uniref:hypothetical protein n=1 Tax=Streptomyces sp. NPDC057445 TaxID=3346136 RepID=UPI00367C6F59
MLLVRKLIVLQVDCCRQISDGLQHVGVVEFGCGLLMDQLGSEYGIELARHDLAGPPTGRGPARLVKID